MKDENDGFDFGELHDVILVDHEPHETNQQIEDQVHNEPDEQIGLLVLHAR